jgi:hypothetical protein
MVFPLTVMLRAADCPLVVTRITIAGGLYVYVPLTLLAIVPSRVTATMETFVLSVKLRVSVPVSSPQVCSLTQTVPLSEVTSLGSSFFDHAVTISVNRASAINFFIPNKD